MTDRARSITVVLDGAVRVDALEATLTAIRQLRGVVAAEPDIADARGFVALERARYEIREAVFRAIDETRKTGSTRP